MFWKLADSLDFFPTGELPSVFSDADVKNLFFEETPVLRLALSIWCLSFFFHSESLQAEFSEKTKTEKCHKFLVLSFQNSTFSITTIVNFSMRGSRYLFFCLEIFWTENWWPWFITLESW